MCIWGEEYKTRIGRTRVHDTHVRGYRVFRLKRRNLAIFACHNDYRCYRRLRDRSSYTFETIRCVLSRLFFPPFWIVCFLLPAHPLEIRRDNIDFLRRSVLLLAQSFHSHERDSCRRPFRTRITVAIQQNVVNGGSLVCTFYPERRHKLRRHDRRCEQFSRSLHGNRKLILFPRHPLGFSWGYPWDVAGIKFGHRRPQNYLWLSSEFHSYRKQFKLKID